MKKVEKIAVILSTVSDEKAAARIARALLKNKSAACVNIIPKIRSIYSWQGKVCDEKEALLVIKTSKRKVDETIRLIKSVHPYEVPEIIAIDVSKGWPDYLRWVADSTG